MNNQKNKSTDDLLGSLDGSQRALAPDFFYTRLKARMEKELYKDRNSTWVLRPVYAMAGFALLLIMNAIVFLQKDEVNTGTSMDTETVQSIVGDYSLNDNTIYDINQEK